MADSKTKLADKYNLTRDDCGKKGAWNLFRFNVAHRLVFDPASCY